MVHMQGKPVLFVDIDGVISLWGFPTNARPPGAFHTVDGVVHFLSATAGKHLLDLAERYELVWCSGWEEKANEYLPQALALRHELPVVSFDHAPGPPHAHWKLGGIEAYAGRDRPVAWIDDAHDDACRAWAAARPGPTLLVTTEPAVGLDGAHVELLRAWAADPRPD
jgi:HAD domain in Swiss Army Knife RNA repair proteins